MSEKNERLLVSLQKNPIAKINGIFKKMFGFSNLLKNSKKKILLRLI